MATMMVGSAIGVAVGFAAGMALNTPQVKKVCRQGRKKMRRYINSL